VNPNPVLYFGDVFFVAFTCSIIRKFNSEEKTYTPKHLTNIGNLAMITTVIFAFVVITYHTVFLLSILLTYIAFIELIFEYLIEPDN
jgi:predicted nuclease of restriction endonuclease-like RecB superfamily